jgi:ubiquitin carboxyl-terminal hydrolase 14
LKAKLLSASRKVKEVEKERAERRKVRKRTKVAGGASSSTAAARGSGDVEMSDSTTTTATAIASNNEDTTTKEKGKEPILGGDLEDENIYRAKEAAEFEALVDSSLKNDLGSSTTGLYELVGLYPFCLLFFMLLRNLFWFIHKC